MKIKCLYSAEPLLTGADAALDMIGEARYTMGAEAIVLNKEAVAERFFALGSGLAGEILQKFVNYGMKLAIYGDFSGYASKPLKDFIRESNRGKDIYFLATKEAALARLGGEDGE